MCTAKVHEYARLAIDGSHEPIMTHRKRDDCVSGMLIWGLTDEHHRTLDRYKSEEFVKQHINLPHPFAKQEVNASIIVINKEIPVTAQAYVWPHSVYGNKGKSDVMWTVDGFWQNAPVCRGWRETMDEFSETLDELFPHRIHDTEKEVQRIMIENSQDLGNLGVEATSRQIAQERATRHEEHGRIEVAHLKTATSEGAEPDTLTAVQDLNMREASIAVEEEPFQQQATMQEEARRNATMAPVDPGTFDASIAASWDAVIGRGYGPSVQNLGGFDASIAAPWDAVIGNGFGSTTQNLMISDASIAGPGDTNSWNGYGTAAQNHRISDASVAAPQPTDFLNGNGSATQNFGTFDANTDTTWDATTWNMYMPSGSWSNTSYTDQATTSVGWGQGYQHFGA